MDTVILALEGVAFGFGGPLPVLRVIAGLVPTMAGSVRLLSRPVAGSRATALVFQDARLLLSAAAGFERVIPGSLGNPILRHCEERSDAAVQGGGMNSAGGPGLPRYARDDDTVPSKPNIPV